MQWYHQPLLQYVPENINWITSNFSQSWIKYCHIFTVDNCLDFPSKHPSRWESMNPFGNSIHIHVISVSSVTLAQFTCTTHKVRLNVMNKAFYKIRFVGKIHWTVLNITWCDINYVYSAPHTNVPPLIVILNTFNDCIQSKFSNPQPIACRSLC